MAGWGERLTARGMESEDWLLAAGLHSELCAGSEHPDFALPPHTQSPSLLP